MSHPLKVLWPTYEGLMWACVTVTYTAVAHNLPAGISKMVAAVGVVSYSLYLTHLIVILQMIKHGLTFKFSADPIINGILNSVLIAVPITLFLASLLYQFVEKPFLMFRGRYNEAPDESKV